MRTKKAIYNTISSLLLQVINLICGFILPRAILGAFGSDANGVVSSCSKFIGYIALLEAGVGGVTRAALYKPLADGENDKVSSIVKATVQFFHKIAYIFIGYVILLSIVFPYIIKSNQSSIFVSTMVVVVSLSTFAQYYFGISYGILLQADQRLYISNFLQILTTVANTVLSLILISANFSIHIVKLGTAVVYILRPIILHLYVKRKYQIKTDCIPDNEAIKDRWNGLGHHIAYFLHCNTDVMLLTIFLNVKEVSVYSVYAMVSSGVQSVVTSISNGFEAGLGNIIAKGEKATLNKTFRVFENILSIVGLSFFLTAIHLVIPFVRIYTKNIIDADYIRPLTAYFMLSAELVYCLRAPYSLVTLAAGHYKQTRNQAYMEAAINIGLSLILIKPLGMAGITLATLIAMFIRTIQYALYSSRNILNRSFSVCVHRFIWNIIISIVCVCVNYFLISFPINNYFDFIICGFISFICNLIIVMGINYIVFRSETQDLFFRIKSMFKH